MSRGARGEHNLLYYFVGSLSQSNLLVIVRPMQDEWQKNVIRTFDKGRIKCGAGVAVVEDRWNRWRI